MGASSQRGCERLSQACCPALPAELVDGCDATASQADDAACDDYLAAAAAVDLCTGASGEGGAGASGAASYGPICAGLLNGCCAELPAPLEAACHATGFRGNERMCHQFLENEAKDNGFCAGVDHADESCDYLTERCCPSLPAGARERCAELAGEGDAARCIDYLGGASDADRCTGRAAEEPFIAATCDALLEACCGTLEPDLAATCDLAALSGSRARCESFRSSIRGFGLCLDAGGEGGLRRRLRGHLERREQLRLLRERLRRSARDAVVRGRRLLDRLRPRVRRLRRRPRDGLRGRSHERRRPLRRLRPRVQRRKRHELLQRGRVRAPV